MPSPGHPDPDDRWDWTDEARVLVTLREKNTFAFQRYIAAMQRRRCGFRGEPVTATWQARFRALVDRVLSA